MNYEYVNQVLDKMLRKSLYKGHYLDLNKAWLQRKRPSKIPSIIFIGVAVAVITAAAAGFAFWKSSQTGRLVTESVSLTTPQYMSAKPSGLITEPKDGAAVGRRFKLIGETKNIDPDKVVVLAVDVDNLRLCWPKKPFIQPNTRFQIDFFEGGPAGDFKVSLYAVDPTYMKKVTQWFDEGIFGGMPLLPSRYLLSSHSFLLDE